MQVMEASSPLASRFSSKSWWLVTKVRNDGYAETFGMRFEDHTYQLLQSYSRASATSHARVLFEVTVL